MNGSMQQALPAPHHAYARVAAGFGLLDILLMAYVFITQLSIRRLTGAEKLATDPAKLDLSNITKIGLWVFGLMFAAWLLSRHAGTLLRAPMRYVLLLFGWLFVTASYAPEPFKALIMASTLLSVFFVFLAFAQERGLPVLFDRLIQVQTVFLAISIVLFFAVPSVSRMLAWDGSAGSRMTGLGGHPNQTGVLASFIIVAIYARCDSGNLSRLFKAAAIGIALVALVLTQSRTSLIAAGLGGMTFFLLRSRWAAALIPILLCLGVAAVLVINLDNQVLAIFARSGDAEELLTGTGRSFIWDLSWSLIKKAPILGYGYDSTFSMFMNEAYLLAGDVGIYIFPHAHNVFLQLCLYGGVIAVALFLILILSIARSALVARDPRIAALLACYLSFTMTESAGFFQYADNMIALLALAVVAAQLAPQALASSYAAYPTGEAAR